MRVFDENKIIELTEYDLEIGFLTRDKLLVKTIPEKPAVEEQWHYEYKRFPNGGSSRIKVVDLPSQPFQPAQEEFEDIFVYRKYSYEEAVNMKIRERYNLSQELAILRQRDTKTNEFNEYNQYAEKCKSDIKKKFKL